MIHKEKLNFWRLIEDSPKDGSFNMAADQVLLDQCTYASKPVFRIYEWDCPTISIGRNEELDQDYDIKECQKLGIPIIRRNTGGKSVLHGYDITYSFVGGQRNAYHMSVRENYRYLAKGFYRFFEKLGLKPEYSCDIKQKVDFFNHVCFAFPSSYEILIDGRKIIGNAQKVKKIKHPSISSSRVILQHGSIPIKDKIPLMAKIFPKTNIRKLKQKMHSLESVGVYPKMTNSKIKNLLKKSFKEIFELEWEYKNWNMKEIKLIDKCEKKFPPIKVKF